MGPSLEASRRLHDIQHLLSITTTTIVRDSFHGRSSRCGRGCEEASGAHMAQATSRVQPFMQPLRPLDTQQYGVVACYTEE